MAIVNINVSVTNPPKPSQLLKSGAMISMGGTTLAAGEYQLLTTKDDLKLSLTGKTISTIAWATGVVTVTCQQRMAGRWQHYPAGCIWRYSGSV
jgi:hypothetical protein